MSNSNCIDDLEELYRWILPNSLNTKTPPHYTVEPSGKIRIEPDAFLGGKRPSVDRAKLNNCDPEKIKKHSTDGVISIRAGDIRIIQIPDCTAGVEYTPIRDNDNPSENNEAHSEIVLCSTNASRVSNSKHKKFRRLLAEMSVCIIEPKPLK